jgi:NAD(P)-dependent dehydrogenase (short-subunit alcohol dehydrogenase family)
VQRPGVDLGMNLTLDGRVALVTGANGGLGAHFAETLATAGAKVALCARRIDTLAGIAARIRDNGGIAHEVALDVTRRDSVVSAFEQVARALGPVTAVVNNAGTAVTKPLLDHTEQDWEQVVGVNLTGAWRVAQEAARHMVKNATGGSIVNIASILGLRVSSQVPSYVASKAALIHLTKAMALELARYKIRVNALAPGYVETAINAEGRQDAAHVQRIASRIPLGRWAQPDDIAPGAVFLCSPAARYVTGTVLAVDGGFLAG